MESMTLVQILNQAVCISLCTNAIGKDKANSEFKAALLYLKIDPVSNPVPWQRS